MNNRIEKGIECAVGCGPHNRQTDAGCPLLSNYECTVCVCDRPQKLEHQLSKFLEKVEQCLTKKLSKALARLEIKYLSIKRAARRADVSCDHIRRAVQKGRLPASNLGSGERPLYRISTTDLDDWVEKNKGGKSLPPSSVMKELKARYLPGVDD